MLSFIHRSRTLETAWLNLRDIRLITGCHVSVQGKTGVCSLSLKVLTSCVPRGVPVIRTSVNLESNQRCWFDQLEQVRQRDQNERSAGGWPVRFNHLGQKCSHNDQRKHLTDARQRKAQIQKLVGKRPIRSSGPTNNQTLPKHVAHGWIWPKTHNKGKKANGIRGSQPGHRETQLKLPDVFADELQHQSFANQKGLVCAKIFTHWLFNPKSTASRTKLASQQSVCGLIAPQTQLSAGKRPTPTCSKITPPTGAGSFYDTVETWQVLTENTTHWKHNSVICWFDRRRCKSLSGGSAVHANLQLIENLSWQVMRTDLPSWYHAICCWFWFLKLSVALSDSDDKNGRFAVQGEGHCHEEHWRCAHCFYASCYPLTGFCQEEEEALLSQKQRERKA